MTSSAWVAIVALCAAIWFLFLVVKSEGERAKIEDRCATLEAEVARLNRVLDEALSDYGAQIAQSNRMARRCVERRY